MIRNFLQDWLAAMLLICALLLGGASAAGVWANAALSLLALAAIGWALHAGAMRAMPCGLRWLAGSMIALPLLQLVPLPPSLWSALPGREGVARVFALIGGPSPWLPLSLDAEATLGAWLALIVPMAMVLVILASGPAGRRHAVQALVIGAVLALALGAAQVAGGEGSRLYPYAFTNFGSAVGPFANRNHLASLLLCALPALAAVAPAHAGGRVVTWLGGAVLTAGVVLVGSGAGIAMLVPVVALTIWLGRSNGAQRPALAMLAVAGVLAGLAMIAAVFAVVRATNESGGVEVHRPFIVATALKAARDHFPAGSGAGTLRRIYPAYEDPGRIAGDYTAHAHCDYAEVLLEYGLPGALLILGVLVWWGSRLRVIWLAASDDRLARAGSAMVGVLLVHSLVDYPLRTAAMAAVAGLGAALAARPPSLQGDVVGKAAPSHIRVTL
ncbi:MAG: O-antigen ligase family protein [Sphingomonadales bacterium]|nr:O-antigen ligase family protein [Sphingomonadales bacterium]